MPFNICETLIILIFLTIAISALVTWWPSVGKHSGRMDADKVEKWKGQNDAATALVRMADTMTPLISAATCLSNEKKATKQLNEMSRRIWMLENPARYKIGKKVKGGRIISIDVRQVYGQFHTPIPNAYRRTYDIVNAENGTIKTVPESNDLKRKKSRK